MSNIVKGDPPTKRNEDEKSDKKSLNSENPPKRNKKKSKTKIKKSEPISESKSEPNSEPKSKSKSDFIPIDSENKILIGPSSSKQLSKIEKESTGSKKSSKTVSTETSGYGIIWERVSTYTLITYIIWAICMVNENC